MSEMSEKDSVVLSRIAYWVCHELMRHFKYVGVRFALQGTKQLKIIARIDAEGSNHYKLDYAFRTSIERLKLVRTDHRATICAWSKGFSAKDDTVLLTSSVCLEASSGGTISSIVAFLDEITPRIPKRKKAPRVQFV